MQRVQRTRVRDQQRGGQCSASASAAAAAAATATGGRPHRAFVVQRGALVLVQHAVGHVTWVARDARRQLPLAVDDEDEAAHEDEEEAEHERDDDDLRRRQTRRVAAVAQREACKRVCAFRSLETKRSMIHEQKENY